MVKVSKRLERERAAHRLREQNDIMKEVEAEDERDAARAAAASAMPPALHEAFRLQQHAIRTNDSEAASKAHAEAQKLAMTSIAQGDDTVKARFAEAMRDELRKRAAAGKGAAESSGAKVEDLDSDDEDETIGGRRVVTSDIASTPTGKPSALAGLSPEELENVLASDDLVDVIMQAAGVQTSGKTSSSAPPTALELGKYKSALESKLNSTKHELAALEAGTKELEAAFSDPTKFAQFLHRDGWSDADVDLVVADPSMLDDEGREKQAGLFAKVFEKAIAARQETTESHEAMIRDLDRVVGELDVAGKAAKEVAGTAAAAGSAGSKAAVPSSASQPPSDSVPMPSISVVLPPGVPEHAVVPEVTVLKHVKHPLKRCWIRVFLPGFTSGAEALRLQESDRHTVRLVTQSAAVYAADMQLEPAGDWRLVAPKWKRKERVLRIEMERL